MRAGRKRKPRPVTLACNRELHFAELPDPLEPGKFIIAARVSGESALLHAFAHGKLQGRGDTGDDARVRLDAGIRLDGLWQDAAGSGAQAIDYSRVMVDTSFVYAGIPERQADAFGQITTIRAFLGEFLALRLFSVACYNVSVHSFTEKWYRGGANGHRLSLEHQCLRDALDRLIMYFGQAEGRAWGRIRAERMADI